MRAWWPEALPRLSRRHSLGLLALIAVGLAASLAGAWLLSRLVTLDVEPVRQWLEDRGPLAPLAFIALLIVTIIVSPIPSVPLQIAAGLAFGIWWGAAYTLVGAELGAIAAFLIARRLGRPGLERWLDDRTLQGIDRLGDRLGWRGIFVMRLIPVFHFDWVSYASGLTKLPLRTYGAATFAGMIVPVVAIVGMGDALARSPALAAAIAGALLALVVVPLAWWAIAGGALRPD